MPNKKRVILLTYYWPPAGGAGVQRWLKMSKFLAQHVDLTIYIPENANYPIQDDSLISEVPENVKIISHQIKEPYAIAEKLNPKNKAYKNGQIEDSKDQSLLSKASLWVRANMFIPDARAWWISPSYKFLKIHIKENPQDVMITTGPPHSVHVIGLKLKQENPDLYWISDFRDPWTQIDYFSKLPLSGAAFKQHEKLEQEVLENSDQIVTVSPTWAAELGAIGKKEAKVIYNGYDKEDFNQIIVPNEKFTITYVGSLNDDRNPKILWNALDELCKNDTFRSDLAINLIGNISDHVIQEITSYSNLKDAIHIKDYMPHKDAVKELMKSHILLLLINKTNNEKGIIPGKFFEYLAAKRKILCLGTPGSDIQNLIKKTNSGVFIDRDDQVKLESTLKIYHQKYIKGLLNKFQSQNCGSYSRKEAAYKFIKMIQNI